MSDLNPSTSSSGDPAPSGSRPVRTRFAPSPTGPLHIGGVRTALFTWMLARHFGGKFVLRIEDTDQKRYQEGAIELITDALNWLGLNYDEGPDAEGAYGPYIQSERLDLYQKWAQYLLDNDKAYYCYCSSERLEEVNKEKQARKEPPGYDRRCRFASPEEITRLAAECEAEGRKPVVRLKVPLDGEVVGMDLIRGEVRFENSTLQDAVMLKSDGYPTYHMAYVIDDHFMEISHVTRSIEWLPSYPLHIHVWNAFGWEIPAHAHLPVLLNPNGQGKLSKRHVGFSADGRKVLVLAREFKEAGYLPEAVVNFLCNIGWNFGDDREIFSVEEAIERFDVTQVQSANSAFPMEKLDWINGVYIREKLTVEELAARLRPVLEEAGFTVDNDTLLKVTPHIQTRITTLNDVVNIAGFFFREDFIPPSAADVIQKKLDAPRTKQLLEKSEEVLTRVPDAAWQTQTLYDVVKPLTEELGMSNSQVFGALRVAVTGQTISTPTFETMEILGKPETLRRIRIAIDLLAE